MLRCAHCLDRLHQRKNQSGFWFCPKCRTRLVNIAALRKMASGVELDWLWSHSDGPDSYRKSIRCPICNIDMTPTRIDSIQTSLDICRSCHAVWFDPEELEALSPPASATEIKHLADSSPLPTTLSEAYRAMGEAMAAHVRKKDEGGLRVEEEMPHSVLATALAFIKLPVETGPGDYVGLPWVTWYLIGLVTITSLLALPHASELFPYYGFIPSEPTRLWGVTFLTSFFLHAGIWHLLANLYFLFVFGDDVEQFLGKWAYLGLLVLSTVTGHLFAVNFSADILTPHVGASGGISGLLGFYAIEFPHQRFYYRIFLRFYSVPAFVIIGLYFISQVLGSIAQTQSSSIHISYLSHLGGLVAGALAALYLKWRSR